MPAGAELPFTDTVPKSPVPPQKGLDEVERAISALEGRHPEHERTRRETVAAAQDRRRVLEQEAAVATRRRRRRILVLGANAVALAVAGVVGWRFFARTQTLRASLERAEAPFAAAGFVELESNALSGRGTLDADVPGNSCFVAVAADGPVHAHQREMDLRAPGSVGWCACAGGRVALEGTGGAGLALLRVDAHVLGGPLARPWAPVTPGAWGDADTDCAEATLDAWIGEHRAPAPVVDDAWLDATPARAPLKRAGFRVVSGIDPSRPFAVVESTAGDCVLAVAANEELLSLRLAGGARPVAGARGALVWCDATPATTTVWREGRSAVVLLAAPGTRVGGLLGMRECAESAGMHVPTDAAWLPNADLAWDATSLLHASTLTDIASSDLPTEAGEPDGRVTAIASAAGARLVSSPADATVSCDPSRATPEPTIVCASSKPVAWWRRSDAPAAAARAPMPLWLSLLASRPEPDAIARIPELLALARRLAREGFEPTVFEGVVELADGVRVVGRAGENAVVAVGLGGKPPWVFPFTDGIPWDLGDAPRVVDLQPGVAVKLVSSPAPPVDKRRTIVFRRSAVR